MSELTKEVERAVGVTKKSRGKLSKLVPKQTYVPSSDDPRTELQKLVRQHRGWTRKSVSILQMASDRKNHVTGDVIKCDLPDDRRADFKAVHDALKKDASKLESAMLRELRKLPIYTEFLSKVFGFGPVVSAYLVAEIDVKRSEKISNLRRYCGLAVIDGRLERPRAGQKNAYNKEIRTRLYQAFGSMWKNAAKKTESAPHGVSTKYLEVWKNYKLRMQHSERYDAVKNTLIEVSESGCADAREIERSSLKYRKGAKMVIHSTGWHKSADVFIEDLYTVWRAIEGLPCWPSYYAAKLGYAHGGKISVNAPKLMTLSEALATVGNPGAVPLPAPDAFAGDEIDIEETDDVDELDVAAAQ
jgi:hypothetical protein